MAQLQKGTDYTATSPAGYVTVANLNAHVDSAVLLAGAITEQIAIGAATAADDLVLVSDTSASGALRKVALSNLLPASEAGDGLTGGGGSPLAVNVDDATIEIDTDALQVKDGGIGAAKLDQDLAADVTDVTPAADDYVLIGDTSDSGNLKKALISELVTASGFTPAFTSSEIAVAGAVSAAHSLGRVPYMMRCVLVCVTPEAGWEAGDEIEMPGDGHYEVGASNTSHYVGVGCNATNCYFGYASAITFVNRTTGAGANLTAGNWRVKFYAW
jgi:hypothetical protein